MTQITSGDNLYCYRVEKLENDDFFRVSVRLPDKTTVDNIFEQKIKVLTLERGMEISRAIKNDIRLRMGAC